ncbi:MAG: hypothetical protein NWR96_00445 [Crocinitomicaceae bacterium]|nr:hypothetical protein [Crocinitomicaceae bacterium]
MEIVCGQLVKVVTLFPSIFIEEVDQLEEFAEFNEIFGKLFVVLDAITLRDFVNGRVFGMLTVKRTV